MYKIIVRARVENDRANGTASHEKRLKELDQCKSNNGKLETYTSCAVIRQVPQYFRKGDE
jgi:hypothetical protein